MRLPKAMKMDKNGSLVQSSSSGWGQSNILKQILSSGEMGLSGEGDDEVSCSLKTVLAKTPVLPVICAIKFCSHQCGKFGLCVGEAESLNDFIEQSIN